MFIPGFDVVCGMWYVVSWFMWYVLSLINNNDIFLYFRDLYFRSLTETFRRAAKNFEVQVREVSWNEAFPLTFGTKYSRMDQVKIVKDSL